MCQKFCDLKRGWSSLIAPIRIPSKEIRDSMRLFSVVANVLETRYGGQKATMVFVDATRIGGPIVDRLRQLGHCNVVEVQFGTKSPDFHHADDRAWMWSQMKDWLAQGAIDPDPPSRATSPAPVIATTNRTG